MPSAKPRFFRRSGLSPALALGLRIGAALLLVGIALAGHWLDRQGLWDNTDGAVSFIDVIYFTMITVTTRNSTTLPAVDRP